MIINWNKYVQWMLPTFMRTKELVELIRVLVWQVPRNYSSTEVWAEQAKYKANINASKMHLEKLIEREFAVMANVQELDGKPTDFLVDVSGSVDEVRLKALIDQYKLAGKSYAFKIGDVAFTVDWSNYVCEDIIEVFTVNWSEYVCEDDGIVPITVSLYIFDDTTFRVTAIASRAVQSDLTITGSILIDTGDGVSYHTDFNVNIVSGNTSGTSDEAGDTTTGAYYIENNSLSVTPQSDAYYNYII